MKDHEIAELVNLLRDIARTYHDHQSLRERIAHLILPVTEELGVMNANYQALMQEFKAVKHRKRELETEVSDLRNTLAALTAPQDVQEPRGTFACPICGNDTPHGHTDEQIRLYRNPRLAEAASNVFKQCSECGEEKARGTRCVVTDNPNALCNLTDKMRAYGHAQVDLDELERRIAQPAARELTDEEILDAWEDEFGGDDLDVPDAQIIAFARSITTAQPADKPDFG